MPPLTLFAMTTIPVSVAMLVASYRKPRSEHPTCANCGYNLTGNTSGICPECGTATAMLEQIQQEQGQRLAKR